MLIENRWYRRSSTTTRSRSTVSEPIRRHCRTVEYHHYDGANLLRELNDLTTIFEDFHKHWQERVRVHFDQVRSSWNFNPFYYPTPDESFGCVRYSRSNYIVSCIWWTNKDFCRIYSLAVSTAVVRPVSQRLLLLLPVRLTSCVRLFTAPLLNTTVVFAPAVVSLSLSWR